MSFDAIAYVDGNCGPTNPGGTGSWGYSIVDSSGSVLLENKGLLAPDNLMTINVAEFAAASHAIKAYRELRRPGPLLVRSDSQLVVMVMRGTWAAKKGAYLPLYHRLTVYIEDLPFKVTWGWVPIAENGRASALSTEALLGIGITPRAHKFVRDSV